MDSKIQINVKIHPHHHWDNELNIALSSFDLSPTVAPIVPWACTIGNKSNDNDGTQFLHYNDVIMITIASQITRLTSVYSTVYSDADQRKHQTPRHWPLCGNFTGDQWIHRTKAINADNFSSWWSHHVYTSFYHEPSWESSPFCKFTACLEW